MALRTDKDELRTLHSEQNHEFLMAKALASDSDLAFELQMQEAVNASLGYQAPPASPPFHAVVFADGDKSAGVMDLAAKLIAEDVMRSVQEHSDREQCQAEMVRMRNDLDRRIFDQSVARKIMQIPEDDWKKNGDNYHWRYSADGASSSSSSSSRNPSNSVVDAEYFRVYCKGLVSEERVKDMTVKVAAVGVAIFDSVDHLIFEVKKPLEVLETDGVVLSNESADLLAVIEGLNGALSLGFRRVTFFCNDSMRQYVEGRVKANPHSKVAGLLNQVFHLQRKFEYCVPLYTARKNMEYAFKFARDAIVSQIRWSANDDKGKSLMETCGICFEDTDVDKMFSVDQCLHRYCFSCMKKHVEPKLLTGMLANCPHEGCKSEVAVDRCKEFLAKELVEVISQRMKESAIPVAEKVYCPYPRCSAVMSKREVLEFTKTTFAGAEQSGARRCMKCHLFFCIHCKVPWHYNMSCNQYRNSNPHLLAEDNRLKFLATSRRWRQCVKCNHIIELAEGCYHITCRCGYEFCYTCGAPWAKKKATCNCPIWDEANIIRGQQRR